MKHVVITGGSRGIGLGLSQGFLKHGHRVSFNCTSTSTLSKAMDFLSENYGSDRIQGYVTDVRSFSELEDFCTKSSERFGPIDIWINNAGINQSKKMLWELDPAEYKNIIEVNQIGLMHGSKIAINHMLKNKGGFLYNMAGFGSDGRIQPGMGLYGTSKRALDYYTRALIKEVENTKVKVGILSPGMVMTDLIYDSIDPDNDKEAKKIFNILADKPETVTPWLVKNMLKENKNGKEISWLTGKKIMWRFLTSSINKRNLWADR